MSKKISFSFEKSFQIQLNSYTSWQLIIAHFCPNTHHCALPYVAASYLIWGIFLYFLCKQTKANWVLLLLLLYSKKYILRPCHIVHILRYCRDSVTTYLIDQSPKINMPSSNTFTLGYVKKWKMRQEKNKATKIK